MSYVIAEPCLDQQDQSCVAVCPVDCISSDPARDRKFYIDPAGCIDCGSCEAACPNQAIFRADQLPPEWARFELIDATWFRDPERARRAVEELKPAA